MMTEKERYDIEKRLNRYYETEEIDVDLANQIHSDASKLLRRLDEIEKGIEKAKDMLLWGNAENAVRQTYDHLVLLLKG